LPRLSCLARIARRSVEAEVGGTVSKIRRRNGECVARDQLMMMIELMRTEIPGAALADGTLARLLVAVGDIVTHGQEVAILKKSDRFGPPRETGERIQRRLFQRDVAARRSLATPLRFRRKDYDNWTKVNR